jgi:hypothetical protein
MPTAHATALRHLIAGTLAFVAGLGLWFVPWPTPPWDDSEAQRRERLERGIAEARGFDAYPLLWLGEEFEGLELVGISRLGYGKYRRSGARAVTFIYGRCSGPPCRVPLTLTVEHPCSPGRFQSPDGEERFVRGAPYARTGSGALWITLPQARIHISSAAAHGADAQALRAAEALRGLSASASHLGPGDSFDELAPGRGRPC